MGTSLGYQIDRHPIAQSFYVEQDTGCFITKVDLYFKSKATSDPVCLQIRPMVDGFPSTDVILPGSVVYVNGSSVNVSDQATTATSFVFEEPLYLKGNRDYAIVVITNSPDYQIFIAQIDEFEIGTTAGRVAKNPALGTLFYSQNGGTFTPSQEQDLTFEIFRAKFDTSTEGAAILQNAELPLKLLDIDPITVTKGSNSVTVFDPGHGFVVNDPVRIEGVDSASNIGGITGPNILGPRIITAVDWTGYTFNAGASADSDGIGGGIDVKVTKNIPFSIYFKNSQQLNPPQTAMASALKLTTGKSFAGTETPYQKSNDFVHSRSNITLYTRKAHVVANSAIETSELGANVKSLEAQYSFQSLDDFVTPMLDMQRSSITLVDALIDRQDSSASTGFNAPLTYVDETAARGGSAATKHITKAVTLINPAVGLKIAFAAQRPPGCDFQVYFRTATSDQNIEDQGYTLTPEVTNNPIDENLVIFRDYQFLPGGDGGQLEEFTKFQIKIVMRSTDKSKQPFIKDLRVIALSV